MTDDIRRTAALWLLAVTCSITALGPLPLLATEFRPIPNLGAGILLVARPGLPDPNFAQTVILLVDYGNGGAMGLIINRPSRHRLAQALPDVDGLTHRDDLVYLGGPVAPQRMGLLLQAVVPPKSSLHVVDDIYFTVSQEVLGEALRRDEAPFHAFAGYAGWGPGQLDNELARGDWRLARADAEIVFEQASEGIWPELVRLTEGVWVFLETDCFRQLPFPGEVSGLGVCTALVERATNSRTFFESRPDGALLLGE